MIATPARDTRHVERTRQRKALGKNAITARNNDARQAGHQAFADKRINAPTNVCYQHVIDCCGTHTYTQAKLETLAARMPGRSKETQGHKSVSSVKNYLRALVKADLVWLDERGIHVTALEPKPAPIAIQQPLGELDEARTLEMIADEIKAAADRGDFAAVARLAVEADTLREHGEPAAPESVEPVPVEAANSPELESKNCPTRVKKLPRVKKVVNPSDVKHQNLLNPRQLSAANCRPHGGDGRTIHRPRNRTTIPDTDATRLLQRYGVRSPAALRNHAAAPLERIEHARRRQLELDAGPGMIVQILDDNGLVWKSGGKRVDNRPVMPPLDDEDAWRERYTNGPLAPYIIGGEPPPPADAEPLPDPELDKYRRDAEHMLIDGWVPPAPRPTPPATPPDDPELEKYRSSLSIPPWMREGGDQ